MAGGGKGLKTSDFNPGTTNLKGGPLPLGIVYLFPVIFVVIEVVSSDFQKNYKISLKDTCFPSVPFQNYPPGMGLDVL